MAELVTYHRTDTISTISMDDGKVNVFSIPMLRALHEAFDEAERDETVVLLTGRPGYFSAGFDLQVLAGPPEDVVTLLRLGATLAERILSFPAPVAVACTGHAFPAGAFLLMAADTRVGADGPFKLGLNEVRIGLTLPWFALVLARHRLTPAHFDHAAVTGAMFDPRAAREAGLLDAVVPPDELDVGRAGSRAGPRPRSTGGRTPPPSSGPASTCSTSCAPQSRTSSSEPQRADVAELDTRLQPAHDHEMESPSLLESIRRFPGAVIRFPSAARRHARCAQRTRRADRPPADPARTAPGRHEPRRHRSGRRDHSASRRPSWASSKPSARSTAPCRGFPTPASALRSLAERLGGGDHGWSTSPRGVRSSAVSRAIALPLDELLHSTRS